MATKPDGVSGTARTRGTHSAALGAWAISASFTDLPQDVVEATEYRVLDVIGLAIAGLDTDFGASIRRAVGALDTGGPCHLLGTAERLAPGNAAFANGALSQAMEYDDTHNESIVHMSGPSVAAALALADARAVTGAELIAAIAIGSEVSCRVGSVAPGAFHKRGFHPTGLFAGFGTTCLAGRLLGLDEEQLVNATGIAGSFASGILESWVDGSQSKYVHPGWAAQAGITAAHLGLAGTTGPATVFEGRFGLFASHLQDESAPRDFARISEGLGERWESRGASFKPYPAAHVIHPYIDAILRLRRDHRIEPGQVREIIVPVAEYILPIVCEPVEEKCRPRSEPHARVSMQYSLAEALHRGRLGKDAYGEHARSDPAVLALADRVRVHADPSFPGPERFKGAVTLVLDDGRRLEAVEEHNRGSAANPLSAAELLEKFNDNVGDRLPADRRERLVEAVLALPSAASATAVTELACPS